VCPENTVSFGQRLVNFLLGKNPFELVWELIITRKESPSLRYLDLIVIAKCKLWKRVLGLSIEVRVYREQLFRWDS